MRAIVHATDADRLVAADLVAVRADGVAALASPRMAAPTPTDSELREHDAITRRIHAAAPSLPSRFGQLFTDEAALAAALADRASGLSATLAAVGERVELAVTLAWRAQRRAPDAREASSGTEYLRAKAVRDRQRQQADQVVARLIEQLPCDRAFIRHVICPRDGVAAIVAILSTRDEVESVRRDVLTFGERSSEVSASVHGTLPPYSFAS